MIDFTSMEVAGTCQSSQALALYYGVFEKNEEKPAFANLLKYIHQKNDCFDCGFQGMHVLFHVLSEHGQGELAYHMITKKEYPSYGYLLACGDTALPERIVPPGENNDSHNHHFLGDIARWFMTRVAGLYVVDDTHVKIRPDFISSLTWARAYYELPAGRVEVSWEKKGDTYEMKVSCPEGVEWAFEKTDAFKTKRVGESCSNFIVF